MTVEEDRLSEVKSKLFLESANASVWNMSPVISVTESL
jgi:hypothetical protein